MINSNIKYSNQVISNVYQQELGDQIEAIAQFRNGLQEVINIIKIIIILQIHDKPIPDAEFYIVFVDIVTKRTQVSRRPSEMYEI